MPRSRRHAGLGWDCLGCQDRVSAGQRDDPGSCGAEWDELFGAHDPEVAGSNPAPATTKRPFWGRFAFLWVPNGCRDSRWRVCRAVWLLSMPAPSSHGLCRSAPPSSSSVTSSGQPTSRAACQRLHSDHARLRSTSRLVPGHDKSRTRGRGNRGCERTAPPPEPLMTLRRTALRRVIRSADAARAGLERRDAGRAGFRA